MTRSGSATRWRSSSRRDIRFFATPADLRDWFDANHETAPELWLGQYKKGSGRPSVTWAQAVDEALCVGWIDGILKRIDEFSHVQRFTPRRKGSNWSAVNVANVERLTAEGRMRPAGIAAFEARTPERTGGLLVRARRSTRSPTTRSRGSGRTRPPGPTGRAARRRIAAR